jgi:hypothetical protein
MRFDASPLALAQPGCRWPSSPLPKVLVVTLSKSHTQVVPQGLLLLAFAPLLQAAQIQQPSGLQDVINWQDGILTDGVGPYDATEQPFSLRFWIGHGLRRAQINIDTRERRFNEELGADQDYPSAIRDLELDELSSEPAEHRLFVLTGLQLNATPTDARIQYLGVATPSAPDVLSETFVSPPAGSSFEYDISSIEVIPQHKLLLAIGNAVDVQNPANNQLLLVLYRYGALPGGGEGLVQLQALERPPLALRPIGTATSRTLIRLVDGEAYEIGGDLIAFVRGPMGVPPKGNPRGVAAVKIDPSPASGGSYLTWYEYTTQALSTTAPPHVVFDPAWDVTIGAQAQTPVPSPDRLGVNGVDLVQVQSGSTQTSLLYMACNEFN